MEHDPTPTSEQIRLMLEMHPPEMSADEWRRLDAVMRSQRKKHGERVTDWWFHGQRYAWRDVAYGE